WVHGRQEHRHRASILRRQGREVACSRRRTPTSSSGCHHCGRRTCGACCEGRNDYHSNGILRGCQSCGDWSCCQSAKTGEKHHRTLRECLRGGTVGEQLHRALEICEEHGDLLPLTLERRLRREDLLGEVP